MLNSKNSKHPQSNPKQRSNPNPYNGNGGHQQQGNKHKQYQKQQQKKKPLFDFKLPRIGWKTVGVIGFLVYLAFNMGWWDMSYTPDQKGFYGPRVQRDVRGNLRLAPNATPSTPRTRPIEHQEPSEDINTGYRY